MGFSAAHGANCGRLEGSETPHSPASGWQGKMQNIPWGRQHDREFLANYFPVFEQHPGKLIHTSAERFFFPTLEAPGFREG